MAKETTAVTAKKEAPAPAIVDDAMLAEFTGFGFENTTSDDYAIPYLSVLQKGSPQVDEDDPEYIENSKPGMLFDSVTREVIPSTRDNEVIIIPCAFERQFVEWAPRESGGGIKGVYSVEEGQRMLRTTSKPEGQSRDVLPNGNSLADTRLHYVIYINPMTGVIGRALISMTSTQLKYSRRWMSVQSGVKIDGPNGTKVQAPSFACQYKVLTTREENDSGSWYSWTIESAGRVTDRGILTECVEFAKAIRAGSVKVSDPDAPGAREPDKKIDDNVPY